MTEGMVYQTRFEQLPVSVFATNSALGAAAADEASQVLKAAVTERGEANVILATGNSQLSFLNVLRTMMDVPWHAINVFHMDEYVNLPAGHSASFPLFLRRHLLDAVKPKAFFPVPGDTADLGPACHTYENSLREHPADLCVMGIGENGHIAFNDPPWADFTDPYWVKVVELDLRSRQQQVGEGHFGSLAEVPTHAVTVTIPGLPRPSVCWCSCPSCARLKPLGSRCWVRSHLTSRLPSCAGHRTRICIWTATPHRCFRILRARKCQKPPAYRRPTGLSHPDSSCAAGNLLTRL